MRHSKLLLALSLLAVLVTAASCSCPTPTPTPTATVTPTPTPTPTPTTEPTTTPTPTSVTSEYLPELSTAGETSKWMEFTNSNQVNTVLVYGNNLWWGTYGGVIRIDLSNGSCTKYTTLDGLVSNMVLAIAIDMNDNLWFGTDKGVSRWDGKTWQTFTTEDGLANDCISTIAVDHQNNVWCGGYHHLPPASSAKYYSNGVSRFDGKNWEIYSETNGLNSNFIDVIMVDKHGYIWFGGSGGSTRYDGTMWKTFTDKDPRYGVRDIKEGIGDDIWLNTSNGISRFDGENWHTVTTENLGSAMAVDAAGRLWLTKLLWYSSGSTYIGTDGHGISFYDGSNWFDFTTANGLSTDVVRDIEIDNNGNIWLATANGVDCYNGLSWHTYLIKNEPPYDSAITSITEDLNGNLWFGTWGGGALRFNGMDWSHYTTDDGLANDLVTGIAVGTDGSIWFGTRVGVSCFDGVTWKTFTGLGGDSILSIAADPYGKIWVGTQGLFVYDGGRWDSVTIMPYIGGSPDWIDHIAMGKGNIMWLIDGSYVYSCDVETRQTEKVSDGTSWTDIFVDGNGVLWATITHGVQYYDGTTWHQLLDGHVDVHVYTMLIDSFGSKWFAVYNGNNGQESVIKCDVGGNWQTFTTADGLSNSNVNCIYQDHDGNIWFGTSSGLSLYQP